MGVVGKKKDGRAHHFIAKGKPTEKGFREIFHGKLRNECPGG